VELAKAVGVEGWRKVDSPQVHDQGGAMSNPGGAGGPREPGEVECPMVLAGVKGGRRADARAKALGHCEMNILRLKLEQRTPHTQEEVAHSKH